MNTYGTLFKVTIYGESHQQAIGVIVDGVPAGILFDQHKIEADLEKRKPHAIGTTPRIEKDDINVLSGIFNGYTTGSPIHVMILNQNTQSKDYEHLKKHPRPGHADFVSSIKYHGFQDYRGGGRFSGRLTAALVFAGSIAKMITPFNYENVITSLGTLTDMRDIDAYMKTIIEEGDSVGGVVLITVKDMIVGLGEPFFQKCDAEIAKMLFTIPAVKGVEFGLGFKGAHLKGSVFNDVYTDASGTTKTNHSGGVSGGLSNGNDLVISVMVKPTSSIGKEQLSFNLEEHDMKSLNIGGRHDAAIIRRIGIVLESAVAIALADLYLIHKAYR